MPQHVEPLERLEKMLSKKQLETWMSKLQQTAVAVSLPKVSMEVSHNLQVREARSRLMIPGGYSYVFSHLCLCSSSETPRAAGSERGHGQKQG